MSDPVQAQIDQARQALDDARGARDAGLSDTVVVNRCYYACFHAAQAVLYDRGFEPESHGGVLSLFGSEVVVDGPASKDDGRFLNELSTLRKQADYGHDPLEEEVDALLRRSEAFVEDVTALVESDEEP